MNLPRRLKGWNKYVWSILLLFLIIGWFYPVVGIIAFVCMLSPVVFAYIKGTRKWCVTFCPRGIFNDVILKRISRNDRIPEILHSRLIKILFLMLLFYRLYNGLKLATDIISVGMVFVEIMSITTALTIILGVVFHPRSWCALCPMGFLSNITITLKKAWSFSKDSLVIE